MLFNTKEIKSWELSSRAEAIVERKTKDVVNKLESNPFTFKGALEKLQKRSNLLMVRRKLGRIVSKNGKGGLIVVPVGSEYVISALEVTGWSSSSGELLMIEGNTGKTEIFEDTSYPIYTKLYYKNGAPVIDRYIKVDNAVEGEPYIKEIMKTVYFDSEKIPAQIFFNNEEHLSDMEYARITYDLLKLENIDMQLMSEFRRTRTLMAYNLNMTGADAKASVKQLDNGTKTHLSDNSVDGKYAAGESIVAATPGIQQLYATVLQLEDHCLKQLGLPTDTINSGSNNHNAEVLMHNQIGSEMIEAQRLLREYEYNVFFERVSTLLKTETPTISLELSFIEKSKRDMLEASILQAKQKSQNINSQIESKKGE